MVPPLAVTPTWSGMRSMTGWGVWGSSSAEWAPVMPHTFRANSTTASCIPRQMPRKGILFSRAYRMASILPSMPRFPKPPGTKMPWTPASSRSAVSAVTSSELTQRMFTETPFSMPPWVSASATDRYASCSPTYLPTRAMVTAPAGCLARWTMVAHSVRSGAWQISPKRRTTTSASPSRSSMRGTSYSSSAVRLGMAWSTGILQNREILFKMS